MYFLTTSKHIIRYLAEAKNTHCIERESEATGMCLVDARPASFEWQPARWVRLTGIKTREAKQI